MEGSWFRLRAQALKTVGEWDSQYPLTNTSIKFLDFDMQAFIWLKDLERTDGGLSILDEPYLKYPIRLGHWQ